MKRHTKDWLTHGKSGIVSARIISSVRGGNAVTISFSSNVQVCSLINIRSLSFGQNRLLYLLLYKHIASFVNNNSRSEGGSEILAVGRNYCVVSRAVNIGLNVELEVCGVTEPD